MDPIHNLEPKTGDAFFMNLPKHQFKNPECMAAFIRETHARESARAWSDEEGVPWLVLEVRVVRTIGQK